VDAFAIGGDEDNLLSEQSSSVLFETTIEEKEFINSAMNESSSFMTQMVANVTLGANPKQALAPALEETFFEKIRSSNNLKQAFRKNNSSMLKRKEETKQKKRTRKEKSPRSPGGGPKSPNPSPISFPNHNNKFTGSSEHNISTISKINKPSSEFELDQELFESFLS
jgi:hypothetical protein